MDKVTGKILVLIENSSYVDNIINNIIKLLTQLVYFSVKKGI